MAGGYKKLTSKDGKPFTSENQPANRGRKPGSRIWRDVLADMMPEDGYISFKNVEEVDASGTPTGKVFKSARVKMATQEMIVLAAIKQAMKGKTDAIRMIWERMDGKPAQPLTGDPKKPITFIMPPSEESPQSDDIE